MLESLKSLITPAVMQRLTLLLNHVLSSEAVAMQRLKPHAGRRLRLVVLDWPTALPDWPIMMWSITPAGLLEWGEGDVVMAPEVLAADLTVSIQASNPAQMLLRFFSGQRPRVDVAGDAAFAADVSWLADNLRWDIQEDLSRWMGQIPAHEVGKLGKALAQGLREAAQRLTVTVQQTWSGAHRAASSSAHHKPNAE